jgi:hypothetical protein
MMASSTSAVTAPLAIAAAQQQRARNRSGAQPLPQPQAPRQQQPHAQLDAREQDELHAHAGERVRIAVVGLFGARRRFHRLQLERQAEPGCASPAGCGRGGAIGRRRPVLLHALDALEHRQQVVLGRLGQRRAGRDVVAEVRQVPRGGGRR